MDNLNSIFNKRYGGSANIKGISYQIKYSVQRAFELFNNNKMSITLEGIEDLDLKGFFFDDNTFIQVKTSEKEWKWHQIQKPIINFIEVYKVNPDAKFTLALNNSFKGDLEKLSNYKNLDNKSKKEIEKKFTRLCNKTSNEPEELLLTFLKNLSITHLDDKQLTLSLKQNISNILNINTSAGDIYLSVLISNFLEWAHQRKTIIKADIQNLVSDTKEKIAVETAFQAVGKGLISKINWETNNYVEDYYEGKNTNPSHIAAEADYKRVKWLEIINKAVFSNKLCIIKGSSGQGKSSLLFRYAHDYWLTENTYKLNVLHNLEHVEILMQFFRQRASLGLPILVLIDNINLNLQYWGNLVEACSGFEINFLVTIRKEDWFRYGKENLQFEVIEPLLNFEEAKEIYKLLKGNGKINTVIKSAEIAFEKIGDHKLLIEYIYLITQGEMLTERLKDQVRQIYQSGEDPIKIDILRKVSLANVNNTPVSIAKLVNKLRFNSDPQNILGSLNGEYLIIEDELLIGMHWVRTEHLFKVLFEDYINPANVALEILDIIPEEYIKTFISGMLSDNETDKTILTEGLIKRLKEFNLDVIISIIEGFYIAGENHFYENNKKIFDEANHILGHNGPGFLATDLSIATSSLNLIDRMIEAIPDKAVNWIKLKELYYKIEYIDRGDIFACSFLKKIISDLVPENNSNDILSLAKLLDWVCFCRIETPITNKYSKIILDRLKDFHEISGNNLAAIIQPLYRFDKHLLMNWYNKNSHDIINYLKYCSDSVFVEVQENVLKFKFIVKMSAEDGNAHEQTIKRVNFFQETLPFLKTVSSEGLYCLPDNLKPSNDDTIKNVTKKEFHFEYDIDRNKMFLDIVNNNYQLDSYYEYQEHLYKLRTDILSFFREFKSILLKMIKKIPNRAKSNFDDGKLPQRILDSVKKMPSLPPQTNNKIKKRIEDPVSDWSLSIKGFISQIDEYLADEGKENTLSLSLTNLRNATERLPKLHNAINELCTISPDYNESQYLVSHELSVYPELYDLTELTFAIKPQERINNPIEYIHSKRKVEMNKKISLIKKQFTNLGGNNIFSDTIIQKEGLDYFAIMFTINSNESILTELLDFMKKLYPVKNTVNFFCLLPVKNQKRIVEGYYFISTNTLEKLELGNENIGWETLMPVDMGDDLIQGLPRYEYEFEFKNIVENKDLLNAIILNLKCIEGYRNHLNLYLNDNDELDKKLINNHEKVLNDMLSETKDTIGKLKDKIKNSHNNLNSKILMDLNIIENESTICDITEINFAKWINTINYYA